MVEQSLHLFNPISYLRLLKEITKSLLNPELKEEKPFTFSNLKIVIMVFAIASIFKIIGLLSNQLLNNRIDTDNSDNKNIPLIITVIITGIITPIIEELIFRLPNNFNAKNIAISTSIFLYAFSIGYYVRNEVKEIIENEILIKTVNLCVLILTSYVIFRILYFIIVRYEDKILATSQKHYGKIFYCYAFIFGLLHITNFQITMNNMIYIIPITLPQIVGGLFLGYTRINYGLKYSIFQHSLWNIVLVVLPTLIEKIIKQ